MNDSNYNTSKELYKRLIVRLILGVMFIMFMVFILPRAFRILSPFIIALLVTLIVNAVVEIINRRFSLPTRFASLALSLIVLLAILGLFAFLIYTLVREIIDFSLNIQENWGSILIQINGLLESFNWLRDLFPHQVVNFAEGFEEIILESIQDTSSYILESTLSTTASMISRAGSFFVRLITFFLAWYFITSDYTFLSVKIQKSLSKRVKESYIILKTSVITAFGSYIKAQLTFALLAFVVMFMALSIYGQSYSFLLGLLLGFIDLIPIFGTIALLLPWGVFEIIAGDINKGLFLVILGIAYTIFRRIIEPKIMGNHTGLHPLIALLSIYLGLQLLGVWGAIFGPIIFMLVISIGKSGLFDNTSADIKQLIKRISALLDRR